ncbi:MAG: bifunctional folylpolyglutamate synthase/dihydrofolate synthase [Clostridia bacterium]|nr:bifunctional folylpolyglutamate synthase/dihydrofolate synthase [Clostridia bacterium]
MTSEEYYNSLLRFGIQPGTDRLLKLLELLDNPQDKLQYVHVAGTNGKGTTCALIERALRESGYKTGLYTSPYIVDFRERIRVNGGMITPEQLDAVTETVRRNIGILEGNGTVITEFEAITAAAFLHFVRERCEIVVLETGLGGRFDATNVIKAPVCSVITSISLDHTKILGDTVEKIAFEKSGIIKPGCPAVTVSSQEPEALSVISDTAENRGSGLVIADTDKIIVTHSDIFGSDINYKGSDYHIPFAGAKQTENAAEAIEALAVVRASGFEKITLKAVYAGFAAAENPARCEVVSKEPPVILDGCHNPGAALSFAQIIDTHLKNRTLFAVMGMMADKDAKTVTDILCPRFKRVFTCDVDNPRSLTARELADTIGEKALPCTSAISAYTAALSAAGKNGAVIVCGSLYLCSELYRTVLTNRQQTAIIQNVIKGLQFPNNERK